MHKSQATTAIAAFVLLAALTGCGGGHHHDGGMMNGHHGTRPAPTPTEPPPPATTTRDGTANAQELFLSSGCGDCHTLAAAGATGTAGPNLDQTDPSYQLVIQRVTSGGSGMPMFGDSLTPAEIQAIARYVTDSTR